MFRRLYPGLLLFFAVPSLSAADSVEDLQDKLDELVQQVQSLQRELHEVREEQNISPPAGNERADQAPVNLSAQENSALDDAYGSNVLERPWWRNFDLYGFGAAGYYQTGNAGTRADGSFEIKEASLFLEADVWDDIAFFLELQTNRLGKDDQLFTRTGEVYVHFRELSVSEAISLGVKIGRIDIPFGEEYLWQDSIDNPLITNSAAYPYGWDEGILVYGDIGGFGWIAAVTDGTDARSTEDNSDKAFNLKFFGSPHESLYLSASFMLNGDNTKTAIEFGGSHFQPVGASHQSSLGTSASEQVDSNLLEFDAKYSFNVGDREAYVAASLGGAEQEDADPGFDRSLLWFSIEPFVRLTPRWYVVLRYSEIGTYDNDEGYHFDGKTFAGGNSAFGYDVERFQRLGLGLGWTPNPRVRAKAEIGKDWFDLVDASPLSPMNGDRNFFGLEMAVGF